VALTITARGPSLQNIAQSTWGIIFPQAMAAGSMGVIVIAIDNTGSGGAATTLPSSATDSAGNVWTFRRGNIYDPGAAAAGVETAIYTSLLTNPITTSTQLNLTLAASTTAKCCVIWEVTGSVGVPTWINAGGGVNVGSATGAPTVTTPSINAGDAVIAGGGAESADTWVGDIDTTNGSWSAKQSTAAGTGTSGMSVISQYKVVTATGTQTYNPTLTSADCCLLSIWITEVIADLPHVDRQMQQLLAA
jgi:hypothetical protein